jgi:hypothetical protein
MAKNKWLWLAVIVTFAGCLSCFCPLELGANDGWKIKSRKGQQAF